MKKLLLALALFSVISCNKDFGNYFDQEIANFPSPSLEHIESITKEDPLYAYLGLNSKSNRETLTDVGCIEFIYPFVLFRFDDSDNYLNQISVLGNENFATILDELKDGYSIGLSYPISGNLIDGTSVTVENNEQLQQSLETCIEEELEIIIGNCNEIVEGCIWRITESDPEESPYIDSFFTLREDGSVVFSVLVKEETNEDGESEDEEEEPEYTEERGTWIFYFIGADLHMNINFGPTETSESGMEIEEDTIKSDWNFDWKVNYIDFEKIEIEKSATMADMADNDDDDIDEELATEVIILEKECEEADTNEIEE